MTQLHQDACHTVVFAEHKHAKQILTQNRMRVGRVTFSRKGHISGQYVFIMAKSRMFSVLYFQLLFLSLLFP